VNSLQLTAQDNQEEGCFQQQKAKSEWCCMSERQKHVMSNELGLPHDESSKYMLP